MNKENRSEEQKRSHARIENPDQGRRELPENELLVIVC